jgi:hypothetical protein
MALSQADFYAYSRATGAPIPRDPEEQAQMAPEVLAFRRNQLKSPSQEENQGFNLAQALGVGAALAGLGAGAYGATRFLRGTPPAQAAASAVKPATVDLSGAAVRRAAAEPIPQAPAPTKSAGLPVVRPSTPPPAPRIQSRQPAEGFSPRAYVESTGSLAEIPQGQATKLPKRANQPGSFADLTEIQNNLLAQTRDQLANAVESGEDQVTGRIKTQLQRNEDYDMSQIETLEDDVAEKQHLMMQEAQPSQMSGYEPGTAINQVASQLPDGLPTDQIENFAQSPGAEQRKISGFKTFSQQAEAISAEAAAQKAAAWALATQRSKAPKNARALQVMGPSHGLTQEEIFHRISASASDYRPGSMEPLTQLDVAALLDPTVPTKNVKDLLGTTLAVRGGRVGRNLDYEVMAEGGGMTERNAGEGIVGEFGSDVYAYNPTTGQFEIDTTADLEDLNLNRGRGTDYEANAADYGDVEGPGGFVLTKGFQERTKSGTTTVPGQISESSGALPGSMRQEREIDRVLPARETLEGDPAAGWTFDPQTGRAYLTGTGTRNKETRTNIAGKPIRIVDTKTGRVRSLGSYQGSITVDDPSYDPTSGGKLLGRYQPATSEPSSEITTQPVTKYMTAQERLIQDEKGNWYVNQAKTKVAGEQPLRGRVGADPNLRDISLNRNELNGVLNNAAEMWSAQGGGSALERQTYLIQSLDNYLKTSKQITLPVLQQNEKRYLSSAAFDFINNIQPGLKETNIYVKPAKVNEQGRPLVNRKTFKTGQIRETPIVDPEYINMEAVPLPGKTKVSGAGGVSAQEVDTETYEGPLTFFAERNEMAPQRLQPGAGRPAVNEPGSVGSRPYLETPPVGFPVKSPGSFARTQNPYTGAAAAAMGPASRVNTGDYQYPNQQLRVNLEPRSGSQLEQLNQFALTANLTPGGRVSRGGLQLGGGMGAIPAGVGTLSESQTISRYGVTGSQLQEAGNRLMAQAAYKRGMQPGPTSATPPPQQGPSSPPLQAPAPMPTERKTPMSTEMAGYARRNATIPQGISPEQARADAVARHIGNYISAAAERMEGPASIQGVKLKGVGQNALRPYQAPSEGMIQQLMRSALRR